MVYILTLRIKKLLENKIKINTIYNSVKNIKYIGIRASLVAWTVKRLPTMRETRVRSLGQEDPLEIFFYVYCENTERSTLLANCKYTAQYWRRQWHPTPVLLPGKSHGRRSLVGCSPWGR